MSVAQHHTLVTLCLLAVAATSLAHPYNILPTRVPLCIPVTWSSPAMDTNVFGGNAQPAVDSLEDCQAVCELTLACVGIDWNPGNGPDERCFTIFTRTGVRNNETVRGVTHYDVIARKNCTTICSDTWNDGLANTNVLGGTVVPSADSVEACKAACVANSACTGVDWNPSNIAGLRCFAVIPPVGPRNIGSALGITHYDIVRNSCTGGGPLVSALPSTITGTRSTTVAGGSTTSTTTTTSRPPTIPGVCQNILVQQHFNRTDFFNRTWNEFKAGFGDTSGNYWLGNEQLHTLTQGNMYKIRFELQSKASGLWYWAEYSTFTVGNESTQYTLTVAGFNGNVTGDAVIQLHDLNGKKFSTKDRDNDEAPVHCAQERGGGFWHYWCNYCDVNSADDQFRWYYLSSTSDWLLRTSRMWLVCR